MEKSEYKFIGCLLTIFILFFSSCGNKKDRPTIAPPVKVKVMEAGINNHDEIREYSGTVSSSESTTVSFAVPGRITELYVKEGQKVAKGQLLGKVRNGEYENAYNIAQAQLAEAQDGYERLKKLHDANALPEVKWVEIQQKLKQAQNMSEMAERTLNDANLHSPVSGTVTRKYADVGQTVMSVEPIYEIVSIGDLTIDVAVSENEIGSFKIGDTARVTLKSLDLSDIMGKVTQKSVVADPLTRTFTVKVSIPNVEGKVLPGMIGQVRFFGNNLQDNMSEIIIPSQAVLLNADNRVFVWVVKDSVAQRKFITADVLVEDGVVVKSGLEPGEKVIVAGMQKVSSGTKVIPMSY